MNRGNPLIRLTMAVMGIAMAAFGLPMLVHAANKTDSLLQVFSLPKEDLNADSSVELAVAAFLPERYIADEITRLEMYKRISSVYSEDDRSEVTDELIDRFGDIPRETENLLDIVTPEETGMTAVRIQTNAVTVRIISRH